MRREVADEPQIRKPTTSDRLSDPTKNPKLAVASSSDGISSSVGKSRFSMETSEEVSKMSIEKRISGVGNI